MPPKTAGGKPKRRAVKKKPTAAAPAPTKDELFHQTFYTDSSSGDSTDEALTSRGDLRKKRGHKPKRPRVASPGPPVAPESRHRTVQKTESEDADADVRSTLISGDDGVHLKINLTRFLAQSNYPLHQLLSSSGFQLDNTPTPEASDVSKQISFLDLPPEVREPIYRHALVTPNCTISLTERRNFERSGQLLRVCRTIYEEARGVLYGENSFHLTRAHKQRGEYYEITWKEIGYKDIHRFISEIGFHNVAKLRYISIEFEDALPTFTQYLAPHETYLRRYVNDSAVIEVLKTLGKYTELDKFVAGFRGTRNTGIVDYHFMKALCSVRCREFACDSVGPIKVWPEYLQNIKRLVEVEETPDDEIDWNKKKRVIPWMFTDRHR